MPAGSVARTSKVWVPSASAGETVCGLEQLDQEPASTRHSNVEPASVELKEKLGDVLFDGSLGCAVIDVLGAVVSTVQVKLAGLESVLPAVSVARTWKVWLPSPSAGERACGLVQDDHEPASTRHSNVEPASVDVNEKLGVVLLDGSLGCAVIDVFGAVVSTVHV